MWKAYKRESSSSDSTEEDEVAAVGCIEDARARVVAVVLGYLYRSIGKRGQSVVISQPM